MKNKARRLMRKNNKFNYRKNEIKQLIKKIKYVDIEIDRESFNMPIEIPIPFERSEESKIRVEYQPLNVQIKNGDKWEKLVSVRAWGVK